MKLPMWENGIWPVTENEKAPTVDYIISIPAELRGGYTGLLENCRCAGVYLPWL